jgi:aspartate kinase
MALIVQKYGGTSVGNPERIRNVANRVAEWHRQGNQVAVVVSAMSGVTDSLIKLAKEVSDSPNEREMDVLLATGEQTTIALLAMALQNLGIPAVSLTGAQAGIVTDGFHSKAKISSITPKAMKGLLDEGKVIIVAGFQGQTMEGQITTLGRGGSDLTAIAIAAVLKADVCQIYTDVDGVYSADPRIVPNASKIQELSYDEMLEMASLGSKVMQSRSVEFAKKFGVVFEVRSSFNLNPGTIIKEETVSMENVVVRGVSLDRKQAKVVIAGVPDTPGVAAKLFTKIAEANLNVDMIVQNVSHTDTSGKGFTDITFTLSADEARKAKELLKDYAASTQAKGVDIQEGIVKLSLVGIGMRSHSGVAANLFTALSEAGINIQMISTSEIKVSLIIDEAKADDAVRAVHAKFGLDKS